MVLSVTNVLIHVYFICLVVFMFAYWRRGGLEFMTMASVISSTDLHSIICLLTERFHARQRWTGPGNTDERCQYFIFESGFVHDLPSGVVETCNWDVRDNLITGRTLPSPEVS